MKRDSSENDVGSRKSLDGLPHPSPASNGTSENDQPAAIHEEVPPTNDAKQDQGQVAAKPSATDPTQTKATENVLRNPGCDKQQFSETRVSPKNAPHDGGAQKFRPRDLVAFAVVRESLEFLASQRSNSEATRRHFLWSLTDLCNHAQESPDALTRHDPSSVTSIIQRWSRHLKSRGVSSRSINTMLYLVRLLFTANGFAKESIKLEKYYVASRTRVREEYIPSFEEALRMADCSGSLRNRTIILFLTLTGLRNSTARALCWGTGSRDPNFASYTIKKEMESGQGSIIIMVFEEMKAIVTSACKNRIGYYVFAVGQAADSLRLLLQERRRAQGGVVEDNEVVFCTMSRRIEAQKRRFTPMSTRELQIVVKQAARLAGLNHWKYVTPHALRKTFRSFLKNQPQETRLPLDDEEFFMGHLLGGSRDAYFDATKIGEMRAKADRLVIGADHGSSCAMHDICDILGINYVLAKEELKQELGRDPTQAEQKDFLRKKFQEKVQVKSAGRKIQRIVNKEELEKHLANGAVYVDKVDDQRYIIEVEETE
jgi:integrase